MAVGRQQLAATPCRPRKIISSGPVLARPQARMQRPRKRQPKRWTGREPTTSAMAPAGMKVQPPVRPKILAGQSMSASERCRFDAMSGRPVARRPVVMLETNVMPATAVEMMVARKVDKSS